MPVAPLLMALHSAFCLGITQLFMKNVFKELQSLCMSKFLWLLSVSLLLLLIPLFPSDSELRGENWEGINISQILLLIIFIKSLTHYIFLCGFLCISYFWNSCVCPKDEIWGSNIIFVIKLLRTNLDEFK